MLLGRRETWQPPRPARTPSVALCGTGRITLGARLALQMGPDFCYHYLDKQEKWAGHSPFFFGAGLF